uniref:CD99 molecule (Xg blood group) n=1 Tax=Papio anubis TaxID=9555 RepID=A0A2I3MMJ4_PAPAN
MARGAALALLLFGLLGALVAAPDKEGKKPTATPKKPSAGDDFDLGDAVVDGGNDDPPPPNPPKPKPNPNPNQAGSSGSFSDADLADGVSGGEGKGGSDGGGSHRKEGEEADAPGVIPGIVGAIVVAVAGAISSFIAYQKKKLCFKENAEQGEVDMESHRNANAEPAGKKDGEQRSAHVASVPILSSPCSPILLSCSHSQIWLHGFEGLPLCLVAFEGYFQETMNV